MGDVPSFADWLFKNKTRWIHNVVSLTGDDIVDPKTFLSKHREYRHEYDEYLHKLKIEKEREEKEIRKKEFGAKE